MLEIVLGVWPGVAATLSAVLAVYIRLWQPDPKHNAAWITAFALLGTTAIATTITLQVILYEQRQETRRIEAERDNQVSEVKGRMDALLTLIPSLRSGDPQQAVTAVKEAGEIQERVAGLQRELDSIHEAAAPRSISDDAEQAIVAALLSEAQPDKINIGYAAGCDDCNSLASAFLRIFSSAQWETPPYVRITTEEPGIYLSSNLEGDEDHAQRIRNMISALSGLPCGYMRHPGSGFQLQIGRRDKRG